MRIWMIAALFLAPGWAFAQSDPRPMICQTGEREIGAMLPREAAYLATVESLARGMPTLRAVAAGLPDLIAAIDATVNQAAAEVARRRQFLQSLEDLQHQLRLCARRP